MRASRPLAFLLGVVVCVIAGCGCTPYVHDDRDVVAVVDCDDLFKHHVILKPTVPVDGKLRWILDEGRAPLGRTYLVNMLFSSEADYDAFIASGSSWSLIVSEVRGSQSRVLRPSRSGVYNSGREARQAKVPVYPHVDRFNTIGAYAEMESPITCGGSRAWDFELAIGTYQPRGEIGVWLKEARMMTVGEAAGGLLWP